MAGPGLTEAFPLFPLGLVAVPGEVVPLHVFEERYRVMFGELLASGGEFGIVWADENGVRDIGCACRIDRVLQRHDDGRLDVLTVGTQPLRVAGEMSHVPYPAADVMRLDDATEPHDAVAHDAALAAYAALVETITGEPPDDATLEAMDAYTIAATVELDAEVKQALLEERSERARLRALAGVLEDLRGGLGADDIARARASSNGKVRL